jgi:tetratricopeptide (TPR) repeat protein
MSTKIDDEAEAAEAMMCCANCGKAEIDNIKLKICTACKLVKYCSVDCQKNHRKQHKKACKKRAIEIHDDRLFRQPDESYLGECPICCLPLPLGQDISKWGLNSCCCKRICAGCEYANDKREDEAGLEHRCPYCREPVPKTQEEVDKNLMKRVKANDPVALLQVGGMRYNEGDYEGALQYFTKAAALGDMPAHYNLSLMYQKGEGVEKDKKKEVYHLEEAAIGGHPQARFKLANHEGRNGRGDRTLKHFIIAANIGHDGALEMVKENFQRGFLSKEDFEAALRGHQAAVDATKSEQRDAAEEYNKRENQED